MTKLMKAVAILALVVLAVVPLAGCSGGSSSKAVSQSSQNVRSEKTASEKTQDIRSERAVGFALAVFTNARVVDGSKQHVNVKTRDADIQRYVDPSAELYEWKADAHDNLGILMQGGSSGFVSDAHVTRVKGDVYYLDVTREIITGTNPIKTRSGTDKIVVIFNEKNLIEHAYYEKEYASGRTSSR